jgi:BolA family transcriptional regulator, general stress-responsive regulator
MVIDPVIAASRVERIRTVVQDTLHPLHLEIRDDSAAHAGHSGGGGKGHFKIRIVSEVFAGKSLVERHRLVHDALAALLETDIHALALSTKAPDEIS